MELNSTPGDITSRKPLDAQFVGKLNQEAMKALGDVNARRKWGNGHTGSPVTVNILCAEIARLNLVQEKMAAALARTEQTLDALDPRGGMLTHPPASQLIDDTLVDVRAALALTHAEHVSKS